MDSSSRQFNCAAVESSRLRPGRWERLQTPSHHSRTSSWGVHAAAAYRAGARPRCTLEGRHFSPPHNLCQNSANMCRSGCSSNPISPSPTARPRNRLARSNRKLRVRRDGPLSGTMSVRGAVLPPRQACYNLCAGDHPCCRPGPASSSGPMVIDAYLIVLLRVTLHSARCRLYKGGSPCKV